MATQKKRSQLMTEVASWETIIAEDIQNMRTTPGVGSNDDMQRVYQDATTVFVLPTSLLAYCLLETPQSNQARTKRPHISSQHWQVNKALDVLRRAKTNDKWIGCYIGSWPVFFLGFAVEHREDIDLIRNDLVDRWSLTSFWEFRRMTAGLELFWSSRKLGFG